MQRPPSPLATPPEPTPSRAAGWLRTIAAASVLPTVGFVLTWGPAELLQTVWPRAAALPPIGILPLLGPGWRTATLMVTLALGFVPGTLVALIDRRRPYAAAAIFPAAMAVVGLIFHSGAPYLTSIAVIAGTALAAWVSAAGGIGLMRLALRP